MLWQAWALKHCRPLPWQLLPWASCLMTHCQQLVFLWLLSPLEANLLVQVLLVVLLRVHCQQTALTEHQRTGLMLQMLFHLLMSNLRQQCGPLPQPSIASQQVVDRCLPERPFLLQRLP